MSDNEFEFGEFQGIQETPIPDMFGGDQAQGVADSPQKEGGASEAPPADDLFGGDFGGEVTSVQQEQPVRPHRPRPQQDLASGIPDPGRPVQRPQRQHRDYDAASQTGARQARTQQMRQGYSQPGQSIEGDTPMGQSSQPQQVQQGRARSQWPGTRLADGAAQAAMQGQVQAGQGIGQQMPDMQGQQMPGMQGQQMPGMQGQPPQGKIKKGFNPFGGKGKKQPKQPRDQGGMPRGPVQRGGGSMGGGPGGPRGPMSGGQGRGGKKKLPIIPIILGVVAVLVLVLVVTKLIGGKKPPEPMVQSYETSGRWVLDSLQSSLNNYNPMDMDAVVGVEDGDSYLAKEWAYVNNVKIRQEFLQTVGAVVKFEYPQVQQMSTTGEGMVDESGNPIMIESYMNNGEAITVTIPDYDKIAKTMDEKRDYVLKMLESAKYTDEDYTWPDELTNLMLQFVLDDGPLPTKTAEITLPIRLSTSGQPYIETDAALDDLLFGSEEFRYMAAKFSQICVGWTGHIDEVYLEYERQHNEEYDRWLELFLTYFEADGGVYDPNGDPKFTNVQKSFHKRTSKWEPWYLRDDNNVIQKYEDGTYIVNYFSVKDENGNDWIQPAEEIEVEVEKVRQLDDPWEEETGIWYNWLGVHWLETEYDGKGSIVTRVGDGSRDHPAGIGTTIITKVLGTDGMYHDVKVALMGYWTGQGAIDYAEKFSSRNRGFTTASVVQLICYEVYVENLEKTPIEFESSEMTLTDRNSNISSRTGTMYDFTGVVHLEGRDDKYGLNKTILNDWATSTELSQKYVCWGKSFGRRFNMVYFDCLAGTGEIPSYSAYKQFTGQSSIDEEITGTESQETPKQAAASSSSSNVTTPAEGATSGQ